MSEESNEFVKLQRVLALKRHEIPPPAYFERFPLRVMARIEAQEIAAGIPWWQKLFPQFSASGGLRGVNALALAGLSLIAFSLFHIATAPVSEDQLTWVAPPIPQRATWSPLPLSEPREGVGAAYLASESGTNSQPRPSGLFEIPSLNRERVSFVLPGQ